MKKLLQDVVKKNNLNQNKHSSVVFKKEEKETISGNPSLKNINESKKENNRLKEIDFLYARKNQGYKNTKNTNYGMWTLAFFAVLFLLFSFSFVFSSVKITINPKIEDTFINKDITAFKNSDSDALVFDLMSLSEEVTVSLEGKEEVEVLIPAKGNVVIYNTLNSSQPLLIDTRLEGSNGKIYKTVERVVVPSATKDGKPGSVKVGIYATESGEEYNSGPLDFKIFGFKGTPKYEKIYARSSDPVSGGMKGRVLQVSEEEKIATINKLKTDLEQKLFKKATDNIPLGFILFKDSVFLDIGKEDFKLNGNKMSVSIKGSLYGFVFSENKIIDFILKNENMSSKDFFISNIRDLSFSFVSVIDWANLANDVNSLSKIDFNISGDAKIVSKINEKEFKNDLLGMKKKDFNSVLSNYPGVNSANVSFKPVWKKTFPDKIQDIKLEINYPN
jgi:hypothetical protein